jgi:hypothetical protein
MMLGYDIYDHIFYNGAFSIASKNDLDDQNLLLATVDEIQTRFAQSDHFKTLWSIWKKQ